ncbi:MAG: hypothetical protein M1838_002232 [Thelocarpon superellum]|nr:MAG: hypothetical protein M1838_002232 [Thelocarpon superellum]
MPRVANPPRANGRVTAKHPAAASPFKSPMKIALNDDAQEKAVRLQSRQALHDIQLNQIKAAASPMRRLNNHARAASSSPKTLHGLADARGKENDGPALAVVSGSTVSPVKRVPILANFEEWMKMATDNKINATNSWNFALIDYFHDMSLLKEGDGVNFQKASCTLDGCVKIYTSRVDSVATETGKLLSGLADSGNKKRRGDEVEGEEGEEDGEEEEGEDGQPKRSKKRVNRSSEATLAPSFAPLQLKKFELEFSVDPLFKKASADFDEGGAKGLLLNHLAIDAHGRIVFDSSDDAADASAEGDRRRRKSDSALSDIDEAADADDAPEDEREATPPREEEATEMDMASLAARFFPDLARLDVQDICPSLKNFDLGDPAGSLDIPFLKAADESAGDGPQAGGVGDRSGVFLDDDNAPGFDDDDGALEGFDLPADAGFGEGGEAWARDAAIAPQPRVFDEGFDQDDGGGAANGDGMAAGPYSANGEEYIVSLGRGVGTGESEHDEIMSYFDHALNKQWAGPEHWRIRRIKDLAKSAMPATKARKEKEPFEIDFASPLDPVMAESIYTLASSNSSISLPKSQWRSKTRNLLPDDKHFNSTHLLRLFLKPKARLASRRRGTAGRAGGGHQPDGLDAIPEGELDEAYWARNEGPPGVASEEGLGGGYDADFFQDDGLAFPGGLPDDDDDDFADAQERFSPGVEGDAGADGGEAGSGAAANSQDAAYGNQLVTQNRRLRPEYVQYARVAKKVDVRRLKEEMWRGMGIEDVADQALPPPTPSRPAPTAVSKADDGSFKFTTVMNNLQTVYPKQAMADISTSYCFICLLHLANEKGLVIQNEEQLMDLNIRRDLTAEITEGAD